MDLLKHCLYYNIRKSTSDGYFINLLLNGTYRLARKLRKEGHLVGLLSGELEIQQRAEVINRFRRFVDLVICTFGSLIRTT